MKRILIISMLALLKVGTLHSQTIMVVDMINEAVQNIGLSSTSKMSFWSDSVVISPRTGNVNAQSYAISNIRRITFFDTVITRLDTVESTKILIYPNPVADYLVIDGMGMRDLPFIVFSIDGSVVIRGKYHHGSPIDVRSLASGTYFLKVGRYNCKFVKK